MSSVVPDRITIKQQRVDRKAFTTTTIQSSKCPLEVACVVISPTSLVVSQS